MSAVVDSQQLDSGELEIRFANGTKAILPEFVAVDASLHVLTGPGGTISNFANETGGNLAAAKADLDSIAAALGPSAALNITDTADHLVKNGAGTLVRVVLNTAKATSTLKIYNGTTAGGTLLATIDGTGATGQPGAFNIACSVGIFAKATGTADWTITYV